MPRRLRIGLTGGIASGKSLAAARFRTHGIPVIDADEAARAVVEPGTPGLARVVQHFGAEVLAPDGTLRRRALRDLIFADPVARRDLEAILHPLIRDEMERSEAAAPGSYVVMDIPLLVEGESRGRVDRILVIDVDEPTQLERLRERDGGTLDQARAIIEAQAPRDRRLEAADDVVFNSGSIEDLNRSIDRLHEQYLSLSNAD